MSSGTGKPSSTPKSGPGGFPPNSQAILREKLQGRSTPDSEALASSDDEGELHRLDAPQPPPQPHKPVRRSSWLNDTTQPVPRPRKGSFASSSMSPTTSHPSTPSAESGTGAWGSHSASSAVLGRPAGPATFPWGTGIWNSERKDAPSRLAEVLPSPTSTLPPGAAINSFFGDNLSQGPREQAANPQIPFAIPLHPTPKTYRSQSYSVGQLDPDVTTASMSSSTILPGRTGRVGPPHSGLQHRPSRPSMLSEMSSDGSMLGKVKEVDDDDDESTTDSLQGSQHHSAESKTIEMLARENAMLRQQHQYQISRIRPRASTAAAYGMGNGYSLAETVPEESDYAIDELDESQDGPDALAKRALSRRMSEYGAGPYRAYSVENRKLENVKKAYWQSSLGFGGLGDIPQSRRHSFADVPTRQASISSLGDHGSALEASTTDSQASQEYPSAGISDSSTLAAAAQMAPYFHPGAIPGHPQAMPPYGSQYSSLYPLAPPFQNRVPSPHRVPYMTQPRPHQLLHIVLFKCARADVFYIQEGTGLTVKPGDLVIVEADRGTDLGTVARNNVDWAAAKELKEHYAEEQYKWLMMYSQNAQGQDGGGAGLLGAANGLQGSAVGGMGPPNQHHMQEPNAGELKPKLIKRLAQSHEIHALREKEGNEAKAKRICMQKVKEHGLNMEILDAEFQMDWKKLTFYYFADAYINFNSLVTDLFKVYKTRIWMSAINPASFASPTLGLQAPSGIGPGAVGVGRGSANADRRDARQPTEPQQAAPASQPQPQQAGLYVGGGQGVANRAAYQAPLAQSFNPDRAAVPASAYPQPSYPFTPYPGYSAAPRPGNVGYVPGMMQGIDAYPAGYTQGGEFTTMRSRFPTNPQAGTAPHDQGLSGEWVGQFQGLSLNSR